ncbi:MAG: hypothetical protein WA477_16440 [Candidatus Sulfotelmatobacter sp.]
MASLNNQSSSLKLNEQICAGVKRLGFGAKQTVRLYGEEFEVVSDPFPEAGGIAVTVKTKKSDSVRTLQLPSTVLQSVRGRVSAA